MKAILRPVLLMIAAFLLASSAIGAPAKKDADADLKHYISELKKNPGNKALREKIIKTAAGMKPAPAVPEEAERNLTRGTVFAQKANDEEDYRKAIYEFESALNAAPWVGLAYYNLGVIQEKAGFFSEAMENLKYYLIASPNAKNARDVKNKIYALEAEAEAIEAGMKTPAIVEEPPVAAAGPVVGAKELVVAGKTNLEVEPSDKALRIIKMPKSPDQKAKLPDFSGIWYFKEEIRGEEVTIQAFEITKNATGDLTMVPPKRVADSYATVNTFEIKDKNLTLQMKWKMKSVVGYWKTETYELKISDDGKKLTGSHNQKSVGGRNIDLDRILFKQ